MPICRLFASRQLLHLSRAQLELSVWVHSVMCSPRTPRSWRSRSSWPSGGSSSAPSIAAIRAVVERAAGLTEIGRGIADRAAIAAVAVRYAVARCIGAAAVSADGQALLNRKRCRASAVLRAARAAHASGRHAAPPSLPPLPGSAPPLPAAPFGPASWSTSPNSVQAPIRIKPLGQISCDCRIFDGSSVPRLQPGFGPTSVRSLARTTSSPLGSRKLTRTRYSWRELEVGTGQSQTARIVPRAFFR
jgi:hypothetical protein